MKVIKYIILLLTLLINTLLPQEMGLQRITYQYAPSEWKLFPMRINPFSPVYKTEFCVPESAKISVDIYKVNKNNTSSLIRNHVKLLNFYYSPGIYSLDWSRAEDSLDLPVTCGLYKIYVKGFPKSKDKLVFSDSTLSLNTSCWEDLEVLVRDNDWHYYDSCCIDKNMQLDNFNYMTIPRPKIIIPSVRFRRDYNDITNDQLAIRFELKNERDTNKPTRYLTHLYYCIKDTSYKNNVKIVKEIQYLWKKNFSMIFTYEKGKMILIDYLGYYPVLLNLEAVFERYRNKYDSLRK